MTDNYVCTLTTAEIKKAKDELNEVPEDRLAAVQALREWIQAQPHITCPNTDTIFLLRFLRWSKYSQIRAREKFENFLNLRNTLPKCYPNQDPNEKAFQAMVRAGLAFPLPKPDKNGCTIIFCIMNDKGKDALTKYGISASYRATMMMVEYLASNDSLQVNGMVFVIDMSKGGASTMTKYMTAEAGKCEEEFWKGIPGRFKSFHMYKCGVIMDTLMAFFKPFVPKKVMQRREDKIKRRLYSLSSCLLTSQVNSFIYKFSNHDTMESMYREIPMECLPSEYLPDDYKGPSVGTCNDCIELFLKGITEKKIVEEIKYRSGKDFGIDMSKKPVEGVTQHFRKLNVD